MAGCENRGVWILLVVALWTTMVWEISGDCMMQSPCDADAQADEDDEETYNCYKKRPPEVLPDDLYEELEIHCPDLVSQGSKPLLCCRPKQAELMIYNFNLPRSILSRCPACYNNFRMIFCSFACSPRQDEFVFADEFLEQNSALIKEASYYLEKDFVERVYNSCFGVQSIFAGKVAFDLMCGIHGSKRCNPQLFLDFLGSTAEEGGQAPFKLNFHITSQNETFQEKVKDDVRTVTPMTGDTVKCYESVLSNNVTCSCVDCQESCIKVDLEGRKKDLLIMGQEAAVVIAIIVGCALAAVIFLIFFVQEIQRRRKNKKKPAPKQEKIQNGNDCKPQNGTKTTRTHLPQEFQESCMERCGSRIERKIENGFHRWGVFVATYPLRVMIPALLVSFALCIGLIFFKVTTDPVDLWVSHRSLARQHMEYFNTHFTPFFRIEQIIITPTDQTPLTLNTETTDGNYTWGPVFDHSFLLQVRDLQRSIENLTSEYQPEGKEKETVTLRDICYKPLSPDNDACAIQSVMVYYFQKEHNLEDPDNYLKYFLRCSENIADKRCFGEFGGPLVPADVAFGGFQPNERGSRYHTATALVITIPVVNYNIKGENARALTWETELINFLDKTYKNSNMSIAFRAERSVEDELERGSHSDILIIAISYLVMFAYIAIALGDVRSLKTLFIDTKISLGLVGVFIVLLSVVSSLGIFCYFGVSASLIIVEVIPFLVLAVGVDNIFILVQAFQRDERKKGEDLRLQIGRVVGEVAPSMMLSSVSMSCCFFLGAMTDMPAVQTFALYAGVALIINFFLQMTCFLAVFTYDSQRQENFRFDLACCLTSTSKNRNTPQNTSLLYEFFKNLYAPFLMKTWVRILVMLAFLAWLCSSIAVIDKIDVGLDQELSMPADSYMLRYFKYLNEYLAVGPPLYFVVKNGFNYSDQHKQNLICGTVGCNSDSLIALTKAMEQIKDKSYIALPAMSWMDDYFSYMQTGGCCNENKTSGEHCPGSNAAGCQKCMADPERLYNEDFMKYITYFVKDPPGENCPKGGRALYKDAIQIKEGPNGSEIGATYFMTYHTVLKTSRDFYEALAVARDLSKNMSALLHTEVIPYSLVHVFFEQYLTTWPDTLSSLGFSLLAIFLVTFVLMGLDFFSAVIVIFTIMLIIVNLMGLMYWWSISLNAVSLVNLVVGVGISVEFCSHLTRCFALSPKSTRVARAEDALQKIGSSILSGITLTDCGILVLVFAKSQIFKVFYFRMYVGIIAFGTLHSLLFLPVFLSILGPAVNKKRMYEHIHAQESKQVLCVNEADISEKM